MFDYRKTPDGMRNTNNRYFPDMDPAYRKYVNSRMVDGKIQIVFRDLVGKGQHLEHLD